MKKQFRVAAAVFAAVVAMLVGASAAQAYPSPVFKFTLTKHMVVGTHTFDAKVTANVTCSQWRVWFLDQTATISDAKSATHTFTTPAVAKRVTKQVHAQCTYDASAAAAGTALRVVAAKSPVLTQKVVILPKKNDNGNHNGNNNNNGGGNGNGSNLPGTGGPALWIPIVAGLLVLGGAYTVLRNRRRDDGTDTPAAPATPTV